MGGWWAWILGVACLVLVVLPPRWDPAIRLKEWSERKRQKGRRLDHE